MCRSVGVGAGWTAGLVRTREGGGPLSAVVAGQARALACRWRPDAVWIGGRGSGFMARLGGGTDSFGTVSDVGGGYGSWPQPGPGTRL